MFFEPRKSPRISSYDYSAPNYYFITICTENRKCLFGLPPQLTDFGMVALKHIRSMESHYDHVQIDKYVVMPNHVHFILVLTEGNKSDAGQIIAQYKSGVTREIRKRNPEIKVWQRSFHDHVIRCRQDYEKIWTYIDNNPLKWEEDCFHMQQE